MIEMFESINWTSVVVALISIVGTVFTGVITYTMKKHVYPWLQAKNLQFFAQIAVNAAQAIYGSGYGEEKLKKAMQFLKEKGFNVNSQEVINAILAEWQKLDISQIASGIKKIED